MRFSFRMITIAAAVCFHVFTSNSASAVTQEWVRHDLVSTMGVTTDPVEHAVLDPQGNVYIVASVPLLTSNPSASHTSIYWQVVKYDPNGNRLWSTRFNPAGGRQTTTSEIALDPTGNIVMTGSQFISGHGWDMVTVKLAPTGARLWRRTFNGAISQDDYSNALAIDRFGNIVIGGTSADSTGHGNWKLIKYDPNGTVLWEYRHLAHGHSHGHLDEIGIDTLGNIYAGGSTVVKHVTPNTFMEVAKWDPSGVIIWDQTYLSVGQVSSEPAFGLDNLGEPTLSVCEDITDTSTNTLVLGFLTVRYSSDGDLLWSHTSTFPSTSVGAPILGIDLNGNTVVSGAVRQQHATDYYYSAYYVTEMIRADGTSRWLKRYGPGDLSNDGPTRIVVDPSGRCYVTGILSSVIGDPNLGRYVQDEVTISYDPSGTLMWNTSFSPSNYFEAPTDLLSDGLGNVWVAGPYYSLSAQAGYSLVYLSLLKLAQ